jgi:hypothetical protein
VSDHLTLEFLLIAQDSLEVRHRTVVPDLAENVSELVLEQWRLVRKACAVSNLSD